MKENPPKPQYKLYCGLEEFSFIVHSSHCSSDSYEVDIVFKVTDVIWRSDSFF